MNDAREKMKRSELNGIIELPSDFGIFNETFSKFCLRIVDNCNIKTGRIITKNRPKNQ